MEQTRHNIYRNVHHKIERLCDITSTNPVYRIYRELTPGVYILCKIVIKKYESD